MTTVDLWWLGISFVSGCVLGVFYFGGLWLTVKRVVTARRPGLLSFTSFIIRMSVSVLGFYVIMGGRWERLLIALLGFLAVRSLAIRRWGPERLLSGPHTDKGGSLANQS